MSDITYEIDNSNSKVSNGSGYLGQFEMGYDELVKKLGIVNRGQSGDKKSDCCWVIKFKDGEIATIYNYKNGPAYTGVGNIQDITVWHIGGFKKAVINRVNAILGIM